MKRRLFVACILVLLAGNVWQQIFIGRMRRERDAALSKNASFPTDSLAATQHRISELRRELKWSTTDKVDEISLLIASTRNWINSSKQVHTRAWQNLLIAYQRTESSAQRREILKMWDDHLLMAHSGYDRYAVYQILALDGEAYQEDFMTETFWKVWTNTTNLPTIQAIAYVMARNGGDKFLEVFEEKEKMLGQCEEKEYVEVARVWLSYWLEVSPDNRVSHYGKPNMNPPSFPPPGPP